MSNDKTSSNTRDIYTVLQQNTDKFLDSVRQSVPRYHQSITNAQQEYVKACENVVNSAITMQKEFARKTGFATNVPDATLKIIHNTTEEAIKATSIQNQMTITAIDTAQQNIKAFNDNAKAFAELNNNILKSWLSAFTAGRN